MNSKQKGNRGERELAKILREYGFECRRSQQYAGSTDESADVVGLPYIHIECKRVEKLNIDDAIEQAETDAMKPFRDEEFLGGISAQGLLKAPIPTVFHRRNGKPWKVTMYLDDWMKLYSEYYSGRKIDAKADESAILLPYEP